MDKYEPMTNADHIRAMSDEELAQLARQRLGLVLPGEKIFYFTTDRED